MRSTGHGLDSNELDLYGQTVADIVSTVATYTLLNSTKHCFMSHICGEFFSTDNSLVFFIFIGSNENSIDSLVFETLVPRSILQRYISLLMEHRRMILCGPSGTGKTYLAQKLAEHLVQV